MKLVLALFLLICINLNAQKRYFIEYKFAVLGFLSHVDLTVSNNISFGIKKDKTLFSIGLGREDWNLYYFDKPFYAPTLFNYYSSTCSFSSLLEQKLLLPKTKLSINLGLGAKFYFSNNLSNKYTLDVYNNKLGPLKPSALSKFSPFKDENTIEGVAVGSIDRYRYISSIPYAITTTLAVQYNFKKLALKIYFEPYFMRIKYNSAIDPSKKGNLFIFYNNLGFGINYPLNFKKKDQKVTGIE
jgi:hypothetical protein